MTRPSTRSQSPLEGDTLIQDFIDAFTTSSPSSKQHLLDAITPQASRTATPDDLQRNHLIMAAVMLLPPAQITLLFPTIATTHLWYDGIKPFIGKIASYPASSFLTWSHPAGQTDHTAAAKLMLDQFLQQCPWGLPLTGAAVTDPTYHLLLLQAQAPIIVEPPKLLDYTSSISVVEFFHKLKKYYTAGGKVCLEILLRDLLPALTLRIDTVKYISYDTSSDSQLYHIGWVYYTSFRFLQSNKHLLLEHIKTFRQEKSSILTPADELTSRNKYIAEFKAFYTNFGSMWPTPAVAYASLQKPYAKNFAFLPVTTQIEHLANDATTMDGLLRLTIQQESNLSSLVKIGGFLDNPILILTSFSVSAPINVDLNSLYS